MISRIGNKTRIAKEISKHFPIHNIYIEPFFGAGGMFLGKPKVEHNFVNDIDGEIINFFRAVNRSEDQVIDFLENIIIHPEIFDSQTGQTDVEKAGLLVYRQMLGHLGTTSTIKYEPGRPIEAAIKKIKVIKRKIKNVHFDNSDYREFIKKIYLKTAGQKDATFIYADPPYINTKGMGWSEEDTDELIGVLESTGLKWAISGFDSEYFRKQSYRLEVIGERQNISDPKTEIIICNYREPQLELELEWEEPIYAYSA